MILNLNYYKADKDFELNEKEKKVIEYINNEKKDLEDNNVCDEVLLSLSNIRKNLVYAYDFKPNSNVLEIGAHFGETTGALCEKNLKVKSIEINKERAEAIAKRYKNLENLEIIVGKITDINFEEKFDYITLFGILEYAQKIFNTEKPALDLIMYCKNLLKEDGKLLIATNNKFALKSFVGDIDECTGITFDSITGYKSSNKTYKLGKKQIESILKEANLNNYKFFYPLPDYKLPNLIFTDKYLPSSSKINGYFPYYQENSSIFYSEVDTYDTIIKEDKELFPFFANSYFIVASRENIDNDTKYISFNNYRKEEYQLMTKIRENVVEKTSINEKSQEHLKNMMNNIANLKMQNIDILDDFDDKKIISKFVNAKLASQQISDNKDNLEEILKILNKYKETILSISTPYNENEKTVIEKYLPDINKDIINKFHYLKNGYWDMILKNCFIIEDRCIFFDQEWLEENVPVEFLIYRSIVNIETIRDKIEKYNLYEKMGIKDYINIFEQLDNKITEQIIDKEMFVFYQRKYKNPIYDNYNLQNEKLKLIEENNKLKEENKILIVSNEKNQNLSNKINEQNDRIQELNTEIKRIYDSKSWRFVKKLSKIKHFLKK